MINVDPIPLEERSGSRIELIASARMPPVDSPPEALLAAVADVEVGADGTVFVLDPRTAQVVVFAQDGSHSLSFGNKGLGPGEFLQPEQLALFGQRLWVLDNRQMRLSQWTLDGKLVADNATDLPYPARLMDAVDESHLLVGFGPVSRDGVSQELTFALLDTSGQWVATYRRLEFRSAPRLTATSGTISEWVEMAIASPFPDTAIDRRNGTIYITSGDAYEVLALSQSGIPQWAIRAPWRRHSTTDQEINFALQYYASHVRGGLLPKDIRTRSEPSLARRVQPGAAYFHAIRTDDRGRIFVFPYVPMSWGERDRPVDVYDRWGKLLYSGWISNKRWIVAAGSYVYGMEYDAVDFEPYIVRYRIVEPQELVEWP